MIYKFIYIFIILNFMYDFIDFLLPSKRIGVFVRSMVLIIFLYYFVEIIFNFFVN